MATIMRRLISRHTGTRRVRLPEKGTIRNAAGVCMYIYKYSKANLFSDNALSIRQ